MLSNYFPVLLLILIIVFIAKGVVIVKQSEVIIIERLGRYSRTLQSGIGFIIPILDKIRTIEWRTLRTNMQGQTIVSSRMVSRIDLRETVYDFPRQNVITADNVGIEINALLYFQVMDPVKSVYKIINLPNAIEKLTQTTLRNVIGEMDLDKTLTSRDTINAKLRDILDDATDKWGVKVNRVELQDINPPKEIREAMEKQMRAERDRRAKILTAEGSKMALILEAEGAKESAIKNAEGQAQSRLLVADAEALAIGKISSSVQATGTDPAQYLMALKYIEAFQKVTQHGDKTVVVPYESSALLGSIKSIKEMFVK